MEIALFEFSVSGESGEPIRCDLYRAAEVAETASIAIFCHGFKGFKDWGGWPYFRQELAKSGTIAIGVNFSHNGIGDNPAVFSRLDLFKNDTFSLQSRDLKRVIAALRSGEAGPGDPTLKTRKIILIGHSRGGIPVLANASANSDVSALVPLAAIAHLPDVSAAEESKWRADGVWYSHNSRTDQPMPLGIELLNEIKSNPNLIHDLALQIEAPALIVHGGKDSSVDVAAAKSLNSWIKGSELVIIENGDHNFGTKEPFSGTTPQFEQLITAVKRFIAATTA